MKKILTILIAFIAFAFPTAAQVGIGTDTPDPSSLLDIAAEDRGLLIPRMSLTERDAIQNPANGLLIYQTDSAPGFYFFNGSNWLTFGSAGWLLSGNTGTISGQNYAGTSDNQSLAIGAQGNELIRVLPNGNVGIGTTTPTTALHIAGQPPSVIYSQDFGNPNAPISENSNIDPYQINQNNGNSCNPSQSWQIQGSRAFLSNGSLACNINTTLVIGSFASQGTSVRIRFDYSFDAVPSPFNAPTFRAFLFNETTQTEEATLFTLIEDAIDLSFNDNVSVIQGNLYSLRYSFVGRRLDGITLDNIVVEDNGIPPLRIVDGTEGINRVLVSDGNGNASWQEANSLNFQDDWIFDNPFNSSIQDPIYHQGLVKIGDFDVAQHTLHVQDGNSTSGTRTFWGSVELVVDRNGFLEFNNGLSPIISNSTNLGSPSNRWTTIFSDNGVTSTSDRRLKENIKPLSYGLKEVLQLRPISFQWKTEQLDDFVIPEEEQQTKLGFSAQELLEVIPEMVQTTHWREYEENPGKLQKEEMDRYAVSYSELIPVLVKAIQEQEEQIVALEAQQKRLKKLSKKRK